MVDDTGSASFIAANCPVLLGNSGSPFLNENGDVVGVIWAGSGFNLNSNIDLNVRRRLDEIGIATRSGFFINFAQ